MIRMTTIYFVRHAEPDLSVHDDLTRPLSLKGSLDSHLVTEFLKEKKIDIAISSPFKRSIDTIQPFAKSQALEIEMMEDLRERKVANAWIPNFNEFAKKQWNDFSYKLSDGESLSEVQTRNIAVLEDILNRHKNKNIVVGTHGTALSTIINYYEKEYGYEQFKAIGNVFPWIVKITFEDLNCTEIEKIDVFGI